MRSELFCLLCGIYYVGAFKLRNDRMLFFEQLRIASFSNYNNPGFERQKEKMFG